MSKSTLVWIGFMLGYFSHDYITSWLVEEEEVEIKESTIPFEYAYPVPRRRK